MELFTATQEGNPLVLRKCRRVVARCGVLQSTRWSVRREAFPPTARDDGGAPDDADVIWEGGRRSIGGGRHRVCAPCSRLSSANALHRAQIRAPQRDVSL